MFTGLITDSSKLKSSEKKENGFSISIEKPDSWNDIIKGESIALNGICLTVENFSEKEIHFFVGLETISLTSFLYWKLDDQINLERSLRMGDRLGGHMVSGHIDGVALVDMVRQEGVDSLYVKLRLSGKQKNWVIPKGSICMNGVSLTVNTWDSKFATVELLFIPETLRMTNLGNLKSGDFVNIECDQMVKIIIEKMNLVNSHMLAEAFANDDINNIKKGINQ